MSVSSPALSSSNPYAAVSPQAPSGTTTKPKFTGSDTLGTDDSDDSDSDNDDSTAFSDTSTKPKNNSSSSDSSSSSSGSSFNAMA